MEYSIEWDHDAQQWIIETEDDAIVFRAKNRLELVTEWNKLVDDKLAEDRFTFSTVELGNGLVALIEQVDEVPGMEICFILDGVEVCTMWSYYNIPAATKDLQKLFSPHR